MKKGFIFGILIIGILNSIACVPLKDKKEQEKVSDQELFVEATETINQFIVHLPALKSEIEVHRQALRHPQSESAVVDLKSNEFGLVDRHPVAGEKYRYTYIDDDKKTVRSYEVDVPIDVVVDHEIILLESPDWHNVYRFIFKKGGALTTNGFNINLKGQILSSEEGTLRTFNFNQVAEPGKNGRNGGDIKVFVKEMHGDLTLESYGEGGGAGLPPALFASRDGGSGANGGSSANISFDFETTNDLKINFINREGAKGIGAKGAEAGMVMPICMDNCNGVRGTYMPAGKNGFDGSDGQRGQFCEYQSGRILKCEQ